MLLVNFFYSICFLLMEMKHNKNKIIACTILITLLLSDIGLKKYFFCSLVNPLMSSLDSFIQLCASTIKELSMFQKTFFFSLAHVGINKEFVHGKGSRLV